MPEKSTFLGPDFFYLEVMACLQNVFYKHKCMRKSIKKLLFDNAHNSTQFIITGVKVFAREKYFYWFGIFV
jgi:hypothetical protein